MPISKSQSSNEHEEEFEFQSLVNENTSMTDTIEDPFGDILLSSSRRCSKSEVQVQQKTSFLQRTVRAIQKYIGFIGPGLMVSVAYMDPGNYSTAISAGAANRFSLLFIVLLSNIIAIFLQSLSVRLGSVTGLDLSRACRQNLPSWLNYCIYIGAEIAIIATDLAEVIGSAIALNILLKIPLPAGVALTICDVLFVMLAYKPAASINFVRYFEYGVSALVMVVVICFCIELSYLPSDVSSREVLRGYAPSSVMLQGNGVYIAVSILGATVMPHSLFLGSGLIQPRLREFDLKNHIIERESTDDEKLDKSYYEYKPSYAAIKYGMKYSLIELAVTLFSFALFVNSAILVVAGATLYGTAEAVDADLYTIYDLMSSTISKSVGTIFMVALLCSGLSAGIVCTMAGQIVCEGHIHWNVQPWIRRLITRGISILPCLAIACSLGRDGLSIALNISQVILSVLLPFLTAPLIYFTSVKKIMKIDITNNEVAKVTEKKTFEEKSCDERSENIKVYKDMSNGWIMFISAMIIWVFISVMNIYGLVQVGKNGI